MDANENLSMYIRVFLRPFAVEIHQSRIHAEPRDKNGGVKQRASEEQSSSMSTAQSSSARSPITVAMTQSQQIN